MHRRRFLLALGLMVVAPVLGVDEAVTEAVSYPEPEDGGIGPGPEMAVEVPSSHGLFVGDDIVIRDLSTGVKEFFVITAITGGRITGYVPAHV